MAVNQYDDMLAGNKPPAGNEYDQMLNQGREQQRTSVQQSMFAAGKKSDPDRYAEVMKLSERLNLPPDMVERNYDDVKKKDVAANTDYDTIIDKTPGLAKFIEDPNNATLSKDDLEPLGKVNQATGLIRPMPERPNEFVSFGQDLVRANKTGWKNLESSAYQLAVAYGIKSPEEAAEAVAAANKRAAELRDQMPDYAKEFNRVMAENGNDLEKAKARFLGSFSEMKNGNVLKAIVDFHAGAGRTVGETLEMIGAAVTHPRGFVYTNVEQLPNMAPSLVTGIAGAKVAAAGAAVAGQLGPQVAVPEEVVTVPLAGVVGFAAGSFVGQVPTEVGAWMNETMQKRGIDITDPAQLLKAYQNPQLMAEMRGEAERKGVTTAGVDAIFNAFAGRALSKVGKGAGVVKKGAAAAKDVSLQMAGEAVSEGAGQAAAFEGDLSKVDVGSAIQEGIASMGHSMAEGVIAGGKHVRGKFAKDTATAAVQVAESTDKAFKAQNDAQVLGELGQAVNESKLSKRMPEKMAELINASSPDGEPQAVYFQTDEWDSYWSKKGKSPAKAAEQIMGDSGKAYVEAKESGAPMEIPLGEYVSKVAPTEDYEGLLPAARTSPDGMSLAEAREHVAALPATMEELAKEAVGQQAELQTAEQIQKEESAKAVGVNVVEQLKELGMDEKTAKTNAKLYEKAFKSLGERIGVDPKKLFEKYGLKIGDGSQDVQSDEQVMNQAPNKPKRSVLFPVKQKEGQFTVSPRDDMAASATMTDSEMQISEVKYNDKYMGVAQDMIRSLERQAIGAGKKAITATIPKSQAALVKAYEAQGFSVTQNKDGSSTVTKDLTKTVLEQEGRGQIRFGKDRQFNIELLKSADPSTFIHETGHFYLEVLGDAVAEPGASEQLKADYQTILDWMGVKDRSDIETVHHEQWARGFEAYIMEGKAPSRELRKAFARFRTWLVSVYRQIRNLDVTLTKEVRGVMDRLLATDVEISQAEQEQNFDMMFSDQKASGMNDEQWAKYLAAREEARIHAEETVTRKLIDEHRRSEKQFYKEKRVVVEAEVRAELSQTRGYQALAILQGNLPTGQANAVETFKISEQSLKDMGAKGLPRGVKSPDGIHVEIAAEMLRYTNGQQLVDALTALPPFEDAVNAETDRRMGEFYPDSLIDGTVSEAAIEAVHNDKRAEMMRMELQHMAANNPTALKNATKGVARRVPSQAIIKEHAIQVIGTKKITDIKPNLYLQAERRYAKLAGEAFAAGNIDAAFDAKKKELYNHELYRASLEATADIEKQVSGFKKLFKSDEKVSKSRDTDMVDAARAVLLSHGIGGKIADKYTAMDQLRKIQQYDTDTYETIKALVDSATENAGPYKSMVYDDFVAMADAVNALWDLARTSKQMLVDGQKVDQEQAMGELAVRFSELTKPGPRAGYERAATSWDKVKMGLLGIKSALRRVESWADAMDGGDINGVFRKYIVTPIMEATATYRLAKIDVTNKYLELVKKIEPTLTYNEINARELNYTFKDKAELLGALLHTGNNSNMEKMLVGRNWAQVDAAGNIDRSTWNSFIQRMVKEGVLVKADFDFAQDIWDLLESIKPQAQQAHKQMYGYYFNEVTSNEVVTPFGTYRGGYVPAVADTFINPDANIRAEQEQLTKSNNSFMFPTAGRGFTKSRVEQYRVPLSLNLGMIPAHLDKVMRFVHIEPRNKEVSRMLWNKEFRKTMDAYDPTVAGDMLVPWLQRAAQQKVETPTQGWGGKALDTFFKGVRTRTGLQVMTGNVINALQQTTGLSIAMVKVKPRFLRNALWGYVKAPKRTAADVAAKSDYMKTKLTQSASDIQATIDELLTNPSKYEQARDFAKKHGYFMQAATQNVVDTITWAGAYDQAVEQGHEEKVAVRAADAAVRATQGGLEAENVSRFETGTPFMRAFTMFYSYFNMQSNLLGTEFQKTMRDVGLRKGAGRMIYVYTMGFMVPAVMAEVMVRVMSGKGIDEDDDDQYLDDVLNIFFLSQLRSSTAMLPGVGPAAQSGINSFNDKWYDDRISSSPAVSMVESAVHAPKSVYDAIHDKRKANKAIKDTLTLLGMLTGIPLAPLGRPLGYIADVENKNVKPTGPVDFTRGLITGKGERR